MAEASPSKKFEIPLGMPTTFDPSYKGVGQKPGVDIWRVEQLKVIKKAPTDQCYQGQFYQGDTYIVLNCKIRGTTLDRHIYFWLGKDSTQDEQGVAAYKTVELDMSLGGAAVQHREVQGGESDEFLSIFKSVRYLEGGVGTGFKHVDRENFQTRLLQVKGRRNIRVVPVPVKPESLNSGDVFILDAGRNIYQWNGKQSSRIEKTKALEVTKSIRDQERGGEATIQVIEEGSKDDDKDFWLKFGCPRPTRMKTAEQGGSDDEVHTRTAESAKLIKVSNASGSLTVTEVGAPPFTRAQLDTNDCFILDDGPGGIFVWVGRGSNNNEKVGAMKTAIDYLAKKGYPNTTPITRVVENAETPLFKENFDGWLEDEATKGLLAKPEPGKKFEKKVFDVKTMHQAVQQDAYVYPDDGNGKLEIWRIENFEMAAWPKERYGEFYSGDSYVLFYTYLVNGKEHYIVYFWQGLHSSQDEKGASAIWAKNLDDKTGGAAVQVRVVQGKEPPHFFLLFKGKMIVHFGGHAAGWKNRSDKDSYTGPNESRLFEIHGTAPTNVRSAQVPCRAASLNSADVYILETPKALYIWSGNLSTGDEREFGKTISKRISSKEQVVVAEGKEPADFWTALGGKASYASEKQTETASHPARLFECSTNRGYFYVEEVFEFDQEDLIEEDVMILDTYREVFVWIGNGANPEEKKKGLETAISYVQTDTSGRKVEDTVFLTVKQGLEPPNFTGHFFAWDPEKWSNGKSYDELKKALVSGGGGELTTSVASELAKFTVTQKFTYAQLAQGTLPEGVDPTHKEQYLNDEEFKGVFGMSKAEYNALPAWKKNGIKKKAGLY